MPTQGEGKSGEEHTGESLCLRREDFSGEPLGHSGISYKKHLGFRADSAIGWSGVLQRCLCEIRGQ